MARFYSWWSVSWGLAQFLILLCVSKSCLWGDIRAPPPLLHAVYNKNNMSNMADIVHYAQLGPTFVRF